MKQHFVAWAAQMFSPDNEALWVVGARLEPLAQGKINYHVTAHPSAFASQSHWECLVHVVAHEVPEKPCTVHVNLPRTRGPLIGLGC